jgi:hypothetical protein
LARHTTRTLWPLREKCRRDVALGTFGRKRSC